MIYLKPLLATIPPLKEWAFSLVNSVKEGGITFSDADMMKINSKYKYIIDNTNNTIIMVLAEDELNYLDNPNNHLIRSYIDAVKSNKDCKVFVLENVPQLY